MPYMYIGATAATDSLPCRPLEKLKALLDAHAAGDNDAILRALEEPPVLVAKANLKSLAPRADDAAGLNEATRRFWDEYATKHPQPPAKPGTAIEVSVPPGTDDRLAEIVRRLAEDPQ